MPTRFFAQSKYTLRDVYDEIELLDRKISHTAKFEMYEDEEQREAALRKLSNKREQLAARAKSLTDLGIELPEPAALADTAAQRAPEEAKPVLKGAGVAAKIDFSMQPGSPHHVRTKTMVVSPLALWKEDLEAYKRRRGKASAA